MVLINSNPQSREAWAGFTEAQRAEGLEYYAALTAELAESGELLATESLLDPSQGKWAGRTDGPFAEVKEHLAGFFLLDCTSFDRAVQIASRIPEAGLGLVEVRPVRNLSDPWI